MTFSENGKVLFGLAQTDANILEVYGWNIDKYR